MLSTVIGWASGHQVPVTVVGAGSNLLVRDGGIRGVVVSASRALTDFEQIDGLTVRAGAGLPCTLHSANLSLVTLFSIHFMAAIENAGKYVEFSIEGGDYYPWQNRIFSPGFEIRDGNVLLSDKPGWGIEIDPEWIALADYRVSYNQASS